MAMVCPGCNGTFEQLLECPTCKVRLEYQEAGLAAGGGRWQQTPWGRILVGLLLAQGLAHGLKQLSAAALLAQIGSSSDDSVNSAAWLTTTGTLCLFAFQGLGLLVGGAIAGAGQSKSLLFGSLLGVMNALILFLPFRDFPLARPDQATELDLYAHLLMNPALGALGAFLGAMIWRPLPTVCVTVFPAQAEGKRAAYPTVPLWSGPISWPRVLAGVAIIVAGSVWSHRILDWVLEMSQGALEIKTHFQAWVVQWEISALVTLVGGSVAGAGTGNGMKQGLLAGLGGAIVLVGIHLGNPKVTLETTVFMTAGLVCLTGAGGWFGGQLLPPLVRAPRPRRRRQIGSSIATP